ncbi:MAG: acetamidase/formamidase family protein [Chloroflexi bacterium]|nr:acetamidase/formamidase family protein [Chloroflexota bacterium]
MRVIERHNQMHFYQATDAFVASVAPGEHVLVECSMGSRMPTGPIEVRGAEPGDVVSVRILDITLVGEGAIWARPGGGVLGEELYDLIQERVYRTISVHGDTADFGDGITVRLRPMLGVVGVAPIGPDPILPTHGPGRHGGNMDCNLVVPGATVFLPVYHRGAALAVGDAHGRMGDGEMMTSGLEIESDVTIEVGLHKHVRIAGPIVEQADSVSYLASAKSLDAASAQAFRRAIHAVQQKTGLGFIEAGLLLSMIGDLGVANAVNPLVTARVLVRKSDLALDPVGHPA